MRTTGREFIIYLWHAERQNVLRARKTAVLNKWNAQIASTSGTLQLGPRAWT